MKTINSIQQFISNKVKLNNPLMGTETLTKDNDSYACLIMHTVKLNNPLMGTETT